MINNAECPHHRKKSWNIYKSHQKLINMFEQVNYTNNYFQRAYVLFVASLYPKSDAMCFNSFKFMHHFGRFYVFSPLVNYMCSSKKTLLPQLSFRINKYLHSLCPHCRKKMQTSCEVFVKCSKCPLLQLHRWMTMPRPLCGDGAVAATVPKHKAFSA